MCNDQITAEIDLVPTWQELISTTPASCFGYNNGTASISMEGGCGDIDNSWVISTISGMVELLLAIIHLMFMIYNKATIQ